jgi:hypothetical protein
MAERQTLVPTKPLAYPRPIYHLHRTHAVYRNGRRAICRVLSGPTALEKANNVWSVQATVARTNMVRDGAQLRNG